ncbi:hypothetical protein [Dethiothermospora halolimnae]|uniref:hypothetical protein n=1 Tax=Dethiothermospora halolimnae TaxID=3114390 RepID=UPI003CCBF504
MDKLLEQIKANFPQKAIDISESLELLKESISDTIEKISVKTKVSMDSRDFEKSKVYSQMAEEVYIYELKIDEIMNKLDVAGGDIEEETDEETEKRTIPDYSRYTVDYNVEHTLHLSIIKSKQLLLSCFINKVSFFMAITLIFIMKNIA